MSDSLLQAAKQRLPIPQLWEILNLPGAPARSCRSPFRDDRNASFSVYADGLKWKDHATGEGDDAADFLATACKLSTEDACRKLIQLAGAIPQIPHFPGEEKHPEAEEEQKARKRQRWPIFETPTESEIKTIAELRGLSIEGVSLGAEAGLLLCADSHEGRAWIITDSRRKNAQARRLDGELWARIGAKAWTLPGSEAAWPVGVREASSFPAIALVEGGPDLLAILHLAWSAGVFEHVAPVAMLGASNSFPADALPGFAGKRVRIFAHADEPGMDAAKRWAGQLKRVACLVDGFMFNFGDLNDFARIHQGNSMHEDAEEMFSFLATHRLPAVTTLPETVRPVAVNVAQSAEDTEAHRIAGELMRMHRAGALSGADSPEAALFAKLIHEFNATFGGINKTEARSLRL